MDATIEFRQVDGFPDYRVGSDGSVWSCKSGTWRLLASWPNHRGYRLIRFSTPGTRKSFSVHRIVCRAFHGDPPKGTEVRHLNGMPHDNRASNLRWGTHSENNADKRIHGTSMDGERSPNAKMTVMKVVELRRLARLGETSTQLSAKFGISITQAKRIARGDGWAEVTEPVRQPGRRYKLTRESAARVKRELIDGISGIEIARRFAVSRATVSAIATGRNWAHVEPADRTT